MDPEHQEAGARLVNRRDLYLQVAVARSFKVFAPIETQTLRSALQCFTRHRLGCRRLIKEVPADPASPATRQAGWHDLALRVTF